MGAQAAWAIFNSILQIGEIATAAITQRIKRTVAEKAIEVFAVFDLVAGEIFIFFVLEKRVAVFH